MIAASLAVELAGPRLALHCPASRRGPTVVARPSPRCSSSNPRQFTHLSYPFRRPWIHVGAQPFQPRLFHGTITKADEQAHSEAQPIIGIGTEEANLLASLRSRYPDVEATKRLKPFALSGWQISKEQNAAASHTTAKLPQSQDVTEPHTAMFAGGDVEVTQRTQSYFTAALEAMRQWDTRRLIIYLRRIVALPREELQQAIKSLPRTTISEFLRSLDPKKVAADNDPTDGARISVGMYHLLDLAQHMDTYGTRRLFGKLLLRMNILVECIHDTGQTLDPEDYIPLLRAYGALSDISGAKQLWDQIIVATLQQPSADILHEFNKVRFLVDPMYYGYDKLRIAVTPRNLHRKNYLRFHQSVRRLDRLRMNVQRRRYRFGLDRSMPAATYSLTRRIRGYGPIIRLFNGWTNKRRIMTEEVLCTFMIGFARAGSLRFVGLKILPDYFGIFTQKDKATGQISTTALDPTLSNNLHRLNNKWKFLRPTTRLLDTIVEVYCSNGQLGWAFNLLDYISREYQTPIPAATWFALLEWSHVLRSTPVATGWKMAGWFQQVPARDATELVWNTMTQEPYHVQPGFDQYVILLRSRIARGQFVRADDEIMDKLRTMYDQQCAVYEESVFSYITTLRDGVRPVTAVLSTYQRARFRKHQMWFAISEICKRNLTRLRPVALADARAVLGVPAFILTNHRFVDNAATYRVATGYLSLLDPSRPVKLNYLKRRYRLNVPIKVRGRWRVLGLRPRRWQVLSPQSLAEFKNARLNPLPLLSGAIDAVRLAPPHTRGQFFDLRRKMKRIARMAAYRRRLPPRNLEANEVL